MEGAERRTWAQSGLNARDWASQNACLIDVGYFIHDRLRPHRQVPADLGVKESGLWRSVSCRLWRSVKFRYPLDELVPVPA